MQRLHDLEARRDGLVLRGAALRQSVARDGESLESTLAPATRLAQSARRVVTSPLFIVSAIALAVWAGPRRLLWIAGRAVVVVAVVRRISSIARWVR
jgi:hypothetical protein